MNQGNPNAAGPEFSLGFRLSFVIVLTLFLLLIAEAGLRLFGPELGTIRDLMEVTPDDPRPYVLKPSTTIRFGGLRARLPEAVNWAINSQGIRAAETIPATSGKYRIATYGDSEAYGWSVDYDDTFQRQMERRDDRVEVINFGVPGYNVSNVADTIELTVPEFRPDLVIYLVNKNDFDDPLDASAVVANSALLRLVRFVYYLWIARPKEKQLRDSPERMERFAREAGRIAELSDRNGIPLIFAYLTWKNREAVNGNDSTGGSNSRGPGGQQQATGIPRHLNLQDLLEDDEKMDSHYSRESYRKIADLLCETIGGPGRARCVPTDWQPPVQETR